jgi:sorbitol/mannitol transport system permease protein
MVMVKSQPSRKPRSSKRNPTPWLLWPALGLLIVCTQVPFIMTIYYSFRRFNLLSPETQGWVGLDNYISVLTDPIFWQAMLNTLVLVGWIMAVTVSVGLACAMLFSSCPWSVH